MVMVRVVGKEGASVCAGGGDQLRQRHGWL